jgi:hypothetical protein
MQRENQHPTSLRQTTRNALTCRAARERPRKLVRLHAGTCSVTSTSINSKRFKRLSLDICIVFFVLDLLCLSESLTQDLVVMAMAHAQRAAEVASAYPNYELDKGKISRLLDLVCFVLQAPSLASGAGQATYALVPCREMHGFSDQLHG